jgi:hypothetical protein
MSQTPEQDGRTLEEVVPEENETCSASQREVEVVINIPPKQDEIPTVDKVQQY